MATLRRDMRSVCDLTRPGSCQGLSKWRERNLGGRTFDVDAPEDVRSRRDALCSIVSSAHPCSAQCARRYNANASSLSPKCQEQNEKEKDRSRCEKALECGLSLVTYMYVEALSSCWSKSSRRVHRPSLLAKPASLGCTQTQGHVLLPYESRPFCTS